MGGKSSNPKNILMKNWERVSGSIFRNVLTEEFIEENNIAMDS